MLEELLVELAAATQELSIIKAFAALHDQLLEEPITGEVRLRIIDIVTVHHSTKDGRWTSATLQGYNLVLHAITVKASPNELRQAAAKEEARQIASSLQQLETRVHSRKSYDELLAPSLDEAHATDVSSGAGGVGSAASTLDAGLPAAAAATSAGSEPAPAARTDTGSSVQSTQHDSSGSASLASPGFAPANGTSAPRQGGASMLSASRQGGASMLSSLDISELYAPKQVKLTDEAKAEESARRKADKTKDVVADTRDLVSPGSYKEHWKTRSQLGKGAYSIVYNCTRRDTGVKAAAKWVQKRSLHRKALLALLREIRLMRSIHFKHIVSIVDFYDEEEHFIIVSELMTGGELFDEIVRRSHYSVGDAAHVVKTVVEALAYLHDRGIVHRDLKPENILLSSSHSDSVIKLADLGFARSVTRGGLSTACGTPSYVAPEILSAQRYGLAVDMWSLGVIAYILLCGYAPFADPHQPTLFKKIKRGMFFFDSPQWDNISSDAKDLVQRMLTVNPRERITAAQALKHPWLSSYVGSAQLNTAIGGMRAFNTDRRKVVRQGIVTKQGSLVKSWRRRVFTLTHDAITYADPDSKSTKGVVELKDIVDVRIAGDAAAQAASEASADSECGALFEVVFHSGRILAVRAVSAQDATEWVGAIRMTKAAHDSIARAQVAMSADAVQHAVTLVDDVRRLQEAAAAVSDAAASPKPPGPDQGEGLQGMELAMDAAALGIGGSGQLREETAPATRQRSLSRKNSMLNRQAAEVLPPIVPTGDPGANAARAAVSAAARGSSVQGEGGTPAAADTSTGDASAQEGTPGSQQRRGQRAAPTAGMPTSPRDNMMLGAHTGPLLRPKPSFRLDKKTGQAVRRVSTGGDKER